ncbi:MAG: hypothetical protein ACLUOF_09415 [Ruminococcus sp.]
MCVRCEAGFSADCIEISQAYFDRNQSCATLFVLGRILLDAVVWQGISGQYDGKSASRLRAKPSGGLCAGLPKDKSRRNSRTAGDAVRLYIYIGFGVQETGKSVNFAALQEVYKIIEEKSAKGIPSGKDIIYKRDCNRYAMKRRLLAVCQVFFVVCPI